MFSQNALKDLILFAMEHKIPRFRWKDFEFDLGAQNANQAQLDALRQEVLELKGYVMKIKLKEEFKRVG